MVETKFLSPVVKSLTRDAEERREAVGLLLELFDLPAVRGQIGRIQGCVTESGRVHGGVEEDAVAARKGEVLDDDGWTGLDDGGLGLIIARVLPLGSLNSMGG
ncbi:hypothetical protein HN51_044436 [Arachis hypogaea]